MSGDSVRKYPRDHIIEAVCEFRFALDGPTPQDIDRVIERLSGIYPQRGEIRHKTHAVQLAEGKFSYTEDDRAAGLLVRSRDERDLVQLTTDALTVHRLAPYDHWECFIPRIQEAYAVFQEIAATVKLQRLGLRYINRFPVEMHAKPLELFTCFPTINASAGEQLASFLMRTELRDPDARHRVLLIQMGTTLGTGNRVDFLLDFFRVDMQPAHDWDALSEQLREAHARIKAAFEASITDTLRNQYLQVEERTHDGAA